MALWRNHGMLDTKSILQWTPSVCNSYLLIPFPSTYKENLQLGKNYIKTTVFIFKLLLLPELSVRPVSYIVRQLCARACN